MYQNVGILNNKVDANIWGKTVHININLFFICGKSWIIGKRGAKERELTAEELSERDALRKEYIAEWRRGAEQVLENTYIVEPDGKKRKLERKPRR